MNALELLKADHDKVRNLFQQVRGNENNAAKWEVFEKIRTELQTHTHLEETVFYPAFSGFPQFKELLDECYDEHQEVKDLLAEIEDLEDGEEIVDLLDELMDNVEQHVAEEEGEFFTMARKVMDAAQLEELGDQMLQLRHDIQEAA